MPRPARSPEIEALFAPHTVVAFTSPVSAELISELRQEEQPEIAPMVAARAAEFATARACARAALGELGLIDNAIPRQDGGAPLWPVGATGSISHTRGFCLAVATQGRLSIGIDVEEIGRIKTAVERRILVDPEREALQGLDADDRRKRVGTIFAAKEAFYKAHYEIDPRYLGFDAVAVEVIDGDVSFAPSSGAVDGGLLQRVRGRVRIDAGRAIVAVAIDTTNT